LVSPTRFDPATGFDRLGELVELASQVGIRGSSHRILAIAARSLGASGAALLIANAVTDRPAVVATCGSVDEEACSALGLRAVSTCAPVEEPGTPAPERVALPVVAGSDPAGAIVLEKPTEWQAAARAFARSAAACIGAALDASRRLEEGLSGREQLARRNLQMEALWELAASLQEPEREDEILQTALDLVLRKLDLEAGWIFWGESSRGRLELAASRGVAEEFTARARETGIGTCLCLDVFETGKLRVARNTTECPRLPWLLHGSETTSHACIPLKFERGILGVMNIAARHGTAFAPQELQFLETVGRHVCLAVDKARTARAENRRNAEARALATLAKSIGGSLDLDRVLAAVGQYARELISAERCAIFLGDDPTSLEFAYLAGDPLDGLEVGRRSNLVELGSRALTASLRQRRTLVLQDAAADPRASADLARRWHIGSAVLVPLVVRNRVEGVLMSTRRGPSRWNPEEVELVDALAGQAGVAIENARLYREAKDALLRLQEAQFGMMRAERLATVGTLAASLAHEVRNPLNSIGFQLVLLSRRLARLPNAGSEEMGGLVETARKEITRLDALVEEFLSLARTDRLALAPTDPDAVVHETTVLLEPVARERGLTLTESLAGGLPSLPMDREKMRQVLFNLVRNAIDATAEGGTIRLSTRLDDGGVAIEVTDSGAGIEAGLDVFDFFTTTKRGGTGLGLPIAKRIVEAHGGTLAYTSAPGRGSVFTVSLKVIGPVTSARRGRT
jgi:signal transduction histidine kinase